MYTLQPLREVLVATKTGLRDYVEEFEAEDKLRDLDPLHMGKVAINRRVTLFYSHDKLRDARRAVVEYIEGFAAQVDEFLDDVEAAMRDDDTPIASLDS
jgi:hypothetical protein